MTQKEHLKWLETELDKADKGFIRTKLALLLREKLSCLGYWKNKPRGNPKKGYSMRGKNVD